LLNGGIGRANRIPCWLLESPELSDSTSIFRIARRHRLTFYDAAYLALALRENVALATLDQDLADAAAAENVPLLITA
jgi:predicted nucleic acid-binding protein